jgi:hypothetical protein
MQQIHSHYRKQNTVQKNDYLKINDHQVEEIVSTRSIFL